MKKLLLIVVLGLLLSGNSFANDNRKCINETGFVSDKFNFSKNIFRHKNFIEWDELSMSDCYNRKIIQDIILSSFSNKFNLINLKKKLTVLIKQKKERTKYLIFQ